MPALWGEWTVNQGPAGAPAPVRGSRPSRFPALLLALLLLALSASPPALAWGGGDRFFSPAFGDLVLRPYRSGQVCLEARVQGLTWTADQLLGVAACAGGGLHLLPAVELWDLSGHLSASGDFYTNLPAPLWERYDPGGDRRWEQALLVCEMPWKLKPGRPYFLRAGFLDWEAGSQGRLQIGAREVTWGLEPVANRWVPQPYADLYGWLDEVPYDCSPAAPADPAGLPPLPRLPAPGEMGPLGESIGQVVLDLPEAGARLRVAVTTEGSAAVLVDLDRTDRGALSRYVAFCRAQARRLAPTYLGRVGVVLTFRRPVEMGTVRELLNTTSLSPSAFTGRGRDRDGSPVTFGVRSVSDPWLRLIRLCDRLEADGASDLGVTAITGQVVASPECLGRILDCPDLLLPDVMEPVVRDLLQDALGIDPHAEVVVGGNHSPYWALEELGLLD